MSKVFFITGTDTDVGKTYVTVKLLQQANNNNLISLGLKPIATDSFIKNGILYNNDALALKNQSSCAPEYNEVNPFRFSNPVSPHIVNTNDAITAQIIKEHCISAINKYSPDICYIEGAGGWLCPLNSHETFADIAQKINAPIILTVGIKLGCLNHAVLTANYILSMGIKFHGWVANCLTADIDYSQENIKYLSKKIPRPLLHTFDYQQERALI